MSSDGTIDITNLVENMRSAWVEWALNFIIAAISSNPALTWVNLPVVGTLLRAALQWILNRLSQSAVMGAFFLNTAVRKSSQAKDFTDAVDALNNLPPTTGDDEYEKAERARMDAFDRFVRITN